MMRVSRAKQAASLLALLCLFSVFYVTTLQAQQPTDKPSEEQASNQQAGPDRSERRISETSIEEDWELPPLSAAEEQKSLEDPSAQLKVDGYLQSARVAIRDGRIDQPETDSAWYFYRQALQLDPGNLEAQQGLLAVQQDMISRALEYARELDFESADRILEDAAFVRDTSELIDEARAEIASFRDRRAEQLETAAVSAMDSGNFGSAERVLIELIALGGAESTVNQLRRRLEEARVYGGFKPGQVIRDHFLNGKVWTPDSVIVLAGSFVMGSSAFEEGRNDNEGPQHRVTFRRGFAIGQKEISVAEFRVFADLTKYKTDAERVGWSTVYDQYSGRLTRQDDVHWEMDFEGHKANEDDPVVHVSWNDAKAYTNWLAGGTGKPYRLPSEAEFEYAVRGGKSGLYWWGDGTPGSVVENLAGENDTSRSRRRWSTYFENYGDKYWGPAPTGSFVTNPYGLYDIAGNVGEWVMDCWHETYIRAPVDGTSWVNPGCKLRVIRGGYWASSPEQTRSAFRLSSLPNRSDARIGFRIARDL
jgi:formylglycine-generating enzyme required for sulfatase activity